MMNICFQTTNELLKRERGNRPPSIIQWNYVNWTKMSIQEVRIYYDERDLIMTYSLKFNTTKS